MARNDPAFIERILELTRDGHSRNEVAAMMHVSRNVVCGVVDRAGAGGQRNVWTPERIDQVRQLAHQKHSQTEIARALGSSQSRINNVIRRHIPELIGHFAHGPKRIRPRKPTVRTSAQVLTAQKKKEARAAYVPPPAEAPTPTMVTLMDLEPGQCKFPLDDGAPFHFCGARHWRNLPYCEWHARRCYPYLTDARAFVAA